MRVSGRLDSRGPPRSTQSSTQSAIACLIEWLARVRPYGRCVGWQQAAVVDEGRPDQRSKRARTGLVRDDRGRNATRETEMNHYLQAVGMMAALDIGRGSRDAAWPAPAIYRRRTRCVGRFWLARAGLQRRPGRLRAGAAVAMAAPREPSPRPDTSAVSLDNFALVRRYVPGKVGRRRSFAMRASDAAVPCGHLLGQATRSVAMRGISATRPHEALPLTLAA